MSRAHGDTVGLQADQTLSQKSLILDHRGPSGWRLLTLPRLSHVQTCSPFYSVAAPHIPTESPIFCSKVWAFFFFRAVHTSPVFFPFFHRPPVPPPDLPGGLEKFPVSDSKFPLATQWTPTSSFPSFGLRARGVPSKVSRENGTKPRPLHGEF